MAIPKILKDLNLIVDGQQLYGRTAQFKRATLARKTEKRRHGGGAVSLDMGFADDALDFSFGLDGYSPELVKKLGIGAIDGTQITFTGVIADGDTQKSVEIVARGRIVEADNAEFKSGELGTDTYTFHSTYYKESFGGEVLQEVDLMNVIWNRGGVNMLGELKQLLGI
jgi:hypothetical protein